MPDPRVSVGPLRPPTRPPLMDLGERLTAAGGLPGGECSQALFRSLAALGAAWNGDTEITRSLVGLLKPDEREHLCRALRTLIGAWADVDPEEKP